jgi:uncharacterized cupredoxin-like copper-binding protein
MQNTSTQSRPENAFTRIGFFIVGALATILFLITISRIGLLNIGSNANPTNPEAISLTTENFKFGQPELRVKAGDTVTLNLTNSDLLPHSFDVDVFDVHVQLAGHDQVQATFTPTKPGTFQFYCGIPGHIEAGMVGTLIVER